MITDYASLQTELIANSNRSDLTTLVQTFIQLCEADMQRRLKLVDFETTATVTVTAGVGSLPTGYAGHRSAYWDGDENRPLRYITPDRFAALTDVVTIPTFFTITGSSLKVMSQSTGSVVMMYMARFTPLSASATTNAIVTNYPDAYFHGALVHLYTHTRNDAMADRHKALYEQAVSGVIKDHKDRKYPGPLEVRPR